VFRLFDEFGHLCLVLRIGARVREIYDVQGEADSVSLALEQFKPHRMDGHPLIQLIDRRQESNDLQIGSLAQYMKSPRAIFAAAPTQ
jgi:hypothetical protein